MYCIIDGYRLINLLVENGVNDWKRSGKSIWLLLDHFKTLDRLQQPDRKILPIAPRRYLGKVYRLVYSSEMIWVECCRLQPESFSDHIGYFQNFSNF